MKLKGNDYNFGRIVYLTLGKVKGDPYRYSGLPSQLTDTITIAFDPKTNPQLNTRIDFLVRHQYGAVSTVTKSACSIASIDVYNIGAALESFINAYNVSANSGAEWKVDDITKYVCALEVGYYGGKKTVIFGGVINSYNVERIQTNNQVDNVWHFYAAGTGGSGQVNTTPLTDAELAVSGKDYSQEAMDENQILSSFTSGEEFIKAAVMKHPREVGIMAIAPTKFAMSTFELDENANIVPSTPALAQTVDITNGNFNLYFKIEYKARDSDAEDAETKALWQTNSAIPVGNFDYSNLPETLDKIARIKNCRAEVRFNPNTGVQTIYIFRPELANKKSKGAQHIITNFQNLLKPPTVSGRLIQFTLLLEPTIYPRDTIELRVDSKFYNKYQGNFSFNVAYEGELGNWASTFAGANFLGMANIQKENNKIQTIKQKGNIFNKQYQSLFIIHRGSTHTAEWSTQVDCSCTED